MISVEGGVLPIIAYSETWNNSNYSNDDAQTGPRRAPRAPPRPRRRATNRNSHVTMDAAYHTYDGVTMSMTVRTSQMNKTVTTPVFWPCNWMRNECWEIQIFSVLPQLWFLTTLFYLRTSQSILQSKYYFALPLSSYWIGMSWTPWINKLVWCWPLWCKFSLCSFIHYRFPVYLIVIYWI